MLVEISLNGKFIKEDVEPDETLYQFVRRHGCLSVKCGCETTNCGLCTVFLEDKPVLSCAVWAVQADKKKVTTLEGLQEEAAEFGAFIADQGAEQCGFCNPGFIMNALALFRENPNPCEEEIKEYLAGNLCRCSGYEGQMRGILNFLQWKQKKVTEQETDTEQKKEMETKQKQGKVTEQNQEKELGQNQENEIGQNQEKEAGQGEGC